MRRDGLRWDANCICGGDTMSYTLPQLVYECKVDGQPHCERCRQPVAGQTLRTRMMAFRGVEVEGHLFECPLGNPWIDEPSRGLGDTIAKATKAIGIKPCGRCRERQKLLNKVLPYKKR